MRLFDELPGRALVGGVGVTLTLGGVSKKPKGREDDAAVYRDRAPDGALLPLWPDPDPEAVEAEFERTREGAAGVDGAEDEAAARGLESVCGNRLWIFICAVGPRRRVRCGRGRGRG